MSVPETGDGVHMVMVADDGGIPAKTDEEKREILLRRQNFEIHNYYPKIKELTYESEFVSISLNQAKQLRDYLIKGDNLLQTVNDDSNNQKYAEFAQLYHAIANKINPNFSYFIRLSTRSPKDCVDKPYFRKLLLFHINDCLNSLTHDSSNNNENNQKQMNDNEIANIKLIAIRMAFTKVMCVNYKNAQILKTNNDKQNDNKNDTNNDNNTSMDESTKKNEMMSHLINLMTYSERCVSDLKRYLDNQELLETWLKKKIKTNLFVYMPVFCFQMRVISELRNFERKIANH